MPLGEMGFINLNSKQKASLNNFMNSLYLCQTLLIFMTRPDVCLTCSLLSTHILMQNKIHGQHRLRCNAVWVTLLSLQVRKTLDATMQTLQDMLTVEDFDVSDAFQHSRSTESIKSVASETYMSKLNIAKRRANQQETEMFYFSVSSSLGPKSWPLSTFSK